MMKTIFRIITVCLFIALAAVPAEGQSSYRDYGYRDRDYRDRDYRDRDPETVDLGAEVPRRNPERKRRLKRRLIAPKGDWQVGLSVMYTDFDAANSDYMLVLDGLDARASMFKIAPEASITVANNHALGVKFNYSRLAGALDAATLDLLGNLSLSVPGNISAISNTMGGCVYQRTFVGIDKQGRFGIFWDYIIGTSRAKTQFSLSEDSMSHTVKEKRYFAFAPGVIYYPMNNISIHAGISILDVSYSKTKAYNNDTFVGEREALKANASLNLLNLSFGLAIHL